MLVQTHRFGSITVGAADTIVFPSGLIGFEHLHLWTLLADDQLVWLQSLEDGSVALPTASPFAFVPKYGFSLSGEDREALVLEQADEQASRPLILAVVNRHEEGWTMNLRAPVVIRRSLRLGRQIVTAEEQPLRYALSGTRGILRKTA